jgi:uncharacterized pyridoxamine 5'-phosphate oxidase family protein
MAWKDALQRGQELVLATSSKGGRPHAIYVTSEGMADDKLLINDCQMGTTLKNIEENNEVCIVAKCGGEYYRMKGRAAVYSSGKYFDLCVGRNKARPIRHVIAVGIGEVFDLDKGKKVL